jgi:hypothetical protein
VIGRAVQAPHFYHVLFDESIIEEALGGHPSPTQEVRAFEAVFQPGKQVQLKA